MTRILCLWFPLWPIQRLRCAQPELSTRPLATYDSTPRGERLAACSPLARKLGLRPGMTRAEAEVLSTGPSKHGPVLLVPSSIEADKSMLLELALQAQRRFSPLTALEEAERPECVLLNIEGCAHLFQGERELLIGIVRFFQEQRWRLKAALADTLGAAWALAHFSNRKIALSPAGQTESLLRPLPLAALRLPPEAIATLEELGVRRIEQLLRLPRQELASRLDSFVLKRLRQALGEEPELLIPVRDPEPIRAMWGSEDGLRDRPMLERLCGDLLQQAFDAAHEKGVAVWALECRLKETSGDPEVFRVELVRPTEDVRHVRNLLALQWEQRAIPRVIHLVMIEVIRTGPRGGAAGLLFDAGGQHEERQGLARLVEQLTSRLGKESVLRAFLSPDAQPEFSVVCRPWVETPPEESAPWKLGRRTGVRSTLKIPAATSSRTKKPKSRADPGEAGSCVLPTLPWERPLTLLPPTFIKVWSVVPDGPPQRVQWNHEMRGIVRWWGPERIETGWWRGQQCRREYYRVELETGEWLWLFRRRPEGDWNLQGLFS